MIDTSAIRNRLMFLAISGKLVEQNIDEGNASELIEKLSIELNAKKPCLNINPNEIPYEIPNNWMWCRLSDIGSTNIGLTYHPEDVGMEGIPVLRSNNIKNNRMVFEDLIRVKCEIREKQFINKNDILICARNGSKALVGKCAIYDGELGDASFGAFMAVYRTFCFEYVYYYFQTKIFRRYFENENNKQINQVTQTILKDAIIPLPPLAEQRRIVAKLKETFALLDKIDEYQFAYISNIEFLKNRIIDLGVQGKLTEQLPEDGSVQDLYDDIQKEKDKLIKEKKIKKEKTLAEISEEEIPFRIPDNWKWVRMSEILDVRDGTHDSPQYYGDGIPMITSKNLSSGELNFVNVKYVSEEDAKKINERSAVDDGDILFAMIGTIGNPVLVKKEREFVVKNVALFKKYENTNISMEYIYWYLMREQNEFKKIVSGGLQPFISLKQFRSHIMPLPPYEEQKRIVNRLEILLKSV